VLWRWQPKSNGSGWAKPPCQPNGSTAKTNDPNTWSSYHDVVAAFASGGFDGIGFTLSGSGYAAYDLDHCHDPATGKITDDALARVNRVGSYTEISPSGRGLRIIGEAKGEKHWSKQGAVEIFRNTKHYITITGNALNGNGSGALNNIDDAINADTGTTDDEQPQHTTTGPKTAEDLMSTVFDPIKWVVSNYITEGCTLLVGRPKLGKSWLALQTALAVSTGGNVLGEKCEMGDALYCALEDNERRLHERIRKLTQGGERKCLSRLTYTTEMPRLDKGAISYLKEWLQNVPHPRLIIIDCLAMIRSPAVTSKQTIYDADYSAVKDLRALANKYHVAIIVVHHDRKAEAADAFDTVSGTLGLTGAADSIIVLQKECDGVVLLAKGRDIPSIEKALEFESGRWTVLGDAMQHRITEQRRSILEVLTPEPQSPSEIARASGMKIENSKKMLQRMAKVGQIKKDGHGKYCRLDDNENPFGNARVPWATTQ
jgi:predicted transcriptional regulator